MTSAEMIKGFEVRYDIVNLEGPGYEPEEILVFLNQAQVIEVLKELAVKRHTFISNIIDNDYKALDAIGHAYPFSKFFVTTDTANEYLGYISSKTLLTRTTFKPVPVASWLDNELITKEQSGLYVDNYLNHPILLKPVVYEDTLGKLTLLIDRHTTVAVGVNFYLEYLRKPTIIELSVDCELNSILHERIVNTAVDLGRKVFNPQEAGISQQTDKIMGNPQV